MGQNQSSLSNVIRSDCQNIKKYQQSIKNKKIKQCLFDGCKERKMESCNTCHIHTCIHPGCTAPTINRCCQIHTYRFYGKLPLK